MARTRDFTPEHTPSIYVLTDGPVTIETLSFTISQDLMVLARDNSEWLAPWTVTDSRYNPSTAFSFSIHLEDAGLVGKITLYDIVDERALLTYWIDEAYSNRGVMTKAVRLITKHAAETLGVKWISAGVFPKNPASICVLEKNGYTHIPDGTVFSSQNGLPIELEVYEIAL